MSLAESFKESVTTVIEGRAFETRLFTLIWCANFDDLKLLYTIYPVHVCMVLLYRHGLLTMRSPREDVFESIERTARHIVTRAGNDLPFAAKAFVLAAKTLIREYPEKQERVYGME
jgi:hypothetical protein